ncbi:hypothetical protein KUCAC02_025370 [Chaenocephalus aceratus]|uniref:Uncharacterized protein n=1 Tax=Chaenocephalus aceratus TaxID=36190 RepID=A0ACB9VTR7_CHAAC|nr:hypothetical protein KUCAC02_025370 [Chaenocephalus aceratus]
MAAVWMLVCVLTVCLARDLSPNEISLKKAYALFQSMESYNWKPLTWQLMRQKSTAGRDLKWVIIGSDSTTEDVQNRVVIRGHAAVGGVQNLVIIKDKAKRCPEPDRH